MCRGPVASEPLARVRHQDDGAAILDRAIGRSQIVAAEVEQRVSRRPSLGVADRPGGDHDVPAVVGDLPVMGVPADDRLDPPRLNDRTPLVNARPGEVFPDLVWVVVLEDHHALAFGQCLNRPRRGTNRSARPRAPPAATPGC